MPRAVVALVLAMAAGSCTEPAQPAPPKAPPENVGVVTSALLSHVVFTIPSGKVTADLTNFPVLVKLTSHAGLIANARSDGLDIRFYSDSGGTSLMDFEVESYSAGTLIAWVRVPTVSAASATTFYMRYGDNSSTNFENLNATWETNFGAVWHMQENPAAAGSLQDSSGNGRHQVSYALTPTADTASLIGSGTLLNQNDEYLTFPDFQTTGTTITISAWWKTPSSLSAAFYNYVSKGAAANDSLMLSGGGTTTFQGRARNAAATGAASGNVLVANQWIHLAMVYNGAGSGNSGRLKIYHNGSLIASPTYTGTIPASYVTSAGSYWRIGSTEYNAGYGLMGTADEIHVSSTNRSDAWIKAEYDNQVSGSTFYTTTDIPGPNGSTCSVAGDCSSGFCVTGYCCPSSCDDSNACTVDSCGSSGVCINTPGNVGAECRASAGGCDAAESCPALSISSIVDSSQWSDYGTAPNWNCSTSTTLTASPSSSTTTINVSSTAGFTTSSGAIMVDNEIMFVTSATATAFTVTRGQLGTTAASHTSGAVVGGVTVIDSTGTGSACPAITRDTCGGSATLTHCTNSVSQAQAGGPSVMVVRLSGLTLSNKRFFKLTGDKPIAFLVQGTASITGTGLVDASATGTTTSGPGGDIACGASQGGSEEATGTCSLGNGEGGGGGGGFGSQGGSGGTGDSGNYPGSTFGVTRGANTLRPLLGGCGGGTGDTGVAAGRGGGAFHIAASGTLTMSGTVRANGGAGSNGCGTEGSGAGGGSGGGILLEGGATSVTGTLQANGAAGGNSAWSGSGGAGSTSSASNGTNGQNSAGGGNGGGGGYGRVWSGQPTPPVSGCPADTVATAGTSCRPAVDTCDLAETCTGSSGACPTDAYVSNGTSCRGTAGECDLAELCTGTAVACPADAKRANGTACTSDSNFCTVDQCNGTNVACQYTVAAAGTTCRATADVCDVAETCNGTTTTCPTDLFVSAATSCRGTAGECDLAETCTGSTAACPTDAKRSNGTACTADANVCTLDQCDGSAVTCQHPAGNMGTICNATTGVCDVAETCTGSSTTCPANAYVASSVVCRATVGECDAAENCTGVSATCPATDAKRASGSACSSDGVTCTVDQCDGTTNVCQHPVGNAGVECRGTGGGCDAAETCTGTSTTCPADILTAGGVVCRASAGLCDFEETCTGTSNACPSDVVRTAGFVCRSQVAGGCDVAAETCNGTTGACPGDTYQSSATTCRVTGGVCDLVETCTGSSSSCPADVLAPTSAVCRGTGGVCDSAETCTGTSVACPADVLASSSTPCRFQSNICDAIDFCTGASAACPGDAYAPPGTDCGYTTGATTIYSGSLPTNSAFNNAGYSAASVTNAGPYPTWTDAIRYATTLPTTGANQYLYQRISTTARNFRAYDLIEYDVYLADPQGAIGGLDIENGGTALRDQGLSDQHGNGAHPASSILSNAYGTWYHRRIALGGSNMVNTTSTGWTIVDENDTAHGAYTAYYDNIIVAATAGECTGANVCKIATGYGCTAISDCASNVCNAVTLDASNTHRWNLDSNANATIGGQNGTVSGSPTFNGTNVVLTGTTSGPYISFPTAVMTGLTDVTFEVWFSLDTHVTWQRIFDFGNDGTEYIFVTDRFDGTNIPRVAYKRDNGTEISFNSTAAFPTTTLTHVALSVDGATSMTLYINGTYSGSVALGASDTLAAITFDQNYLGASQYTSDPELDGNVYDFRIYNKALSATEVLATYRKGVDSKVCIAQYPQGTACVDGADCLSTFCVDNRCCNTACGGSTGDCQGCSVAVGAAANGTCGVLSNGTVCRPSIDSTPVGGPTTPPTSCDLPEQCNGVATTCPADTQ